MRKAEIVVLTILFGSLAYVGVVEEGRNRIITIATIAVLAGLVTVVFCRIECMQKHAGPGRRYFPSALCFALSPRGSSFTLCCSC